MKNGILIISESPASGKTFTARIIGTCFKHSLIITYHEMKCSTFSIINLNTDCIIFDGVPIYKISSFYNKITEGIIIDTPYNVSKIIKPKIIITCQAPFDSIPKDQSFMARFDVIKLKQI